MTTVRRFGAVFVAAAVMSLLPTAAGHAASPPFLDPSFGDSGLASVDTSPDLSWASAVARQSDGKVVVAGHRLVSVSGALRGASALVARFLADGRLDPTFATGGVFVLPNTAQLSPTAIAIQTDGKIVVAMGASASAGNQQVDLMRLTTSGALDQTFGQGGLVGGPLVTFYAYESGMALQPDGKIVVAHSTLLGAGPNFDMAVSRFNTDGSLDTSFGTAGRTTVDFSGVAGNSHEWAMAVAVSPSGRIVIGGRIQLDAVAPPVYPGFALAALTPVGTLDATFGTGGRVLTQFPGKDANVAALVAAPDGTVYAAGTVFDSERSQLTVTRYSATGGLDPAFGAGGVAAVIPPGGDSYNGDALAMALDPTGGVVVGGWRTRPPGRQGPQRLFLSRLQASGAPRPGFGGGTVFGPTDVGVSDLLGLTVDPAGQVYVAAKINDQFTVAKYRSGSGAAAFGWNVVGQLGTGTTVDAHAPTAMTSLAGADSVAAGAYHGLAIKGDGTLWGWGWNAVGQVGDGTTTDRSSPVNITPPGVTFRQVAAGAYHSLALDDQGQVWAWGWNALGTLGDFTTTDHATPTLVPNLSGVVAVAAGMFHSLALKSDGSVWAWGWNVAGQLGDGTTTDYHAPVQIPLSTLTNVVAIAGGGYHSLALRGDGTVWAWGWNALGQLGDGVVFDRHVPTQVTGLTGVKAIASGAHHGLALLADGTVRAWGWNGAGQLGDGTQTDRLTPVAVTGLTGVRGIAGGAYHSLALKSDGTVRAWGWNGVGQLGTGLTTDSFVPAVVPGTGTSAVAAGLVQSLVVRASP